jgi:hypothetical protein
MKKVLLLIGMATLLSTTGCIIREHDRGGFHGPREYDHGYYRTYPEHEHRDWDRDDYPR